ncbi:hydroxymethylbilane synthase [Demetria terragena]|uniref:hydroxymethylbilane synthase n=1 Tax=Demetria terragena TaxID=63959 RepID=UPI000376AC37|nr:hydroxymethylbilane synthase [Demetria terragena]
MTTAALRLGTRRSALALAQSEQIADRLRDAGQQVEIVTITTEGDTNRGSLATIGGTGVFAAALRAALLAGEVDLAVHSLKDLPVAPEPGLTVAGIPVREDARDVLVARDGLTLGELPAGSVVGTGSPRRAAQLAALGLGHEVRDIRGNIDTRIGYVHAGQCDGVILARAGLVRTNRADDATEIIDPLQILPAPGQGALAVECRSDRPALIELIATLDDADTRAAVTAERALLGALEAGCSAPVGALAEVVEDVDGQLEISLRGFVGSTDATVDIRRSRVGPYADPERIGHELAEVFLSDGAAEALPPPNRPPATSASTNPARPDSFPEAEQ